LTTTRHQDDVAPNAAQGLGRDDRSKNFELAPRFSEVPRMACIVLYRLNGKAGTA
jgi:hypothetical protein